MTTFDEDGITATPLTWPAGWKRTKRPTYSQFGRHSLAQARDAIIHQLGLLCAHRGTAVISTNLALRRDGLPYSNQAQPHDTGVAVYFKLKSETRVLACDRWNTIEHNAWAVAKHIEAMRGMERWGVGTLEQAFTGYTAIPERTSGGDCWQILGLLREGATSELVDGAYKAKARRLHPDVEGGSHDQMAMLNEARKVAQEQLAK